MLTGTRTLLLALILVALRAAPNEDLMTRVPGYPITYSTNVYSGYLSTGNASRMLHYVFVESISGTINKDPVTLWLNGGPGCSSMLGAFSVNLGFLQQIGPYYLQEGKDYKLGDNLTYNPHSWHQLSNLLFLESPAGVGYSYNLDKAWTFNDSQTTKDALNAIVNFLQKFSEYNKNPFWLAGQSYAGKYIPDLAVAIDTYNTGNPLITINMRGILVGNGLMSFEDGDLEKAQTNYMIDHEFVDPDLIMYWTKSCKLDENSAGCRYFRNRYADNVWEINPYSVYDFCYTNDSFIKTHNPHTQQTILRGITRKFRPVNGSQPSFVKAQNLGFNDPLCAYWDGLHNYFNQNEEPFHAKFKGQQWNGPCAENVTANYHIDLRGSMPSYYKLVNKNPNAFKIVMYNGDWDSVIPYGDTVQNLQQLGLLEPQKYEPWFTGGQHSGFVQQFPNVHFYTVKGASHQVPQKKRAEAYQLFKRALFGATEDE